MQHLTTDQLTAYKSESFEKKEFQEMGRHLLTCEKCRNLLPSSTVKEFLRVIWRKGKATKEQQ